MVAFIEAPLSAVLRLVPATRTHIRQLHPALRGQGRAYRGTRYRGMLTVVRRAVPGSRRPRRGTAAAAAGAPSSPNLYQTSTATCPIVVENVTIACGAPHHTTSKSNSSSCKPRHFAFCGAWTSTSRSPSSSSCYLSFGSPWWPGGGGRVAAQSAGGSRVDSPKTRFGPTSFGRAVTPCYLYRRNISSAKARGYPAHGDRGVGEYCNTGGASSSSLSRTAAGRQQAAMFAATSNNNVSVACYCCCTSYVIPVNRKTT